MSEKQQIYFWSDPHVGHRNIIEYCNRPFNSVEEMNEGLIANYNARVRPNDIVYVLGDLFFCDAKEARQILHRLNGMKRLMEASCSTDIVTIRYLLIHATAV